MTHHPPLVLLVHDGSGEEQYIHYLTAAGFRVAALAAGEPGTDMLEQTVHIGPDIVVLDYSVDGEMVKRLKGDPRTAALPILALAELSRIGKPATAPAARGGRDS